MENMILPLKRANFTLNVINLKGIILNVDFWQAQPMTNAGFWCLGFFLPKISLQRVLLISSHFCAIIACERICAKRLHLTGGVVHHLLPLAGAGTGSQVGRGPSARCMVNVRTCVSSQESPSMKVHDINLKKFYILPINIIYINQLI